MALLKYALLVPWKPANDAAGGLSAILGDRRQELEAWGKYVMESIKAKIDPLQVSLQNCFSTR
jgi:hypothetical protein